MEFRQSLQALFTSEPNDLAAIATAHDRWQQILNKDLDRLDEFYDLYFRTISTILSRPASPGILDRLKSFARSSEGFSDLQAYQFITAFSSSAYLRRPNASEATHFRLLERHGEHLDHIRAAIARPDVAITEKPRQGDSGRWGDIAAAMISLYCRHLAHGPQADRLRAEVAPFVPSFYRTFPQQRQPELVALLEDYPNGVAEVAELIRFYLLDRNDLAGGPMEKVFDGMLGRWAERDDFLHRNGAAILSTVLADAETWSAAARRSFIDEGILTPLLLRPITQVDKLKEQRAAIVGTRDILSRPFVGNGILSAEMQQRGRESQLRRLEDELALIETDFEGWRAQHYDAAVEHIVGSPTTRAILQTVADRLPAGEGNDLSKLIDTATARRAGRKKKLPLPAAAGNRFRDFGLKLLVIDELMYRQEILTPKFDVNAFAKEYDEREILVEQDGYDIIPEVETYFRSLPISEDLLAKVETLSQVAWGSPIVYQLHPFWDAGSGDQVIAIGPQAVDDLFLLPNLRRINGLENSRPDPALLAALAARGITLGDETDA